jgi:hypothetical protein
VRMGRKHVVRSAVGVVDRRDYVPTPYQGFIALVASVVGLQAKPGQFLADLDSFIAVTTRPCA